MGSGPDRQSSTEASTIVGLTDEKERRLKRAVEDAEIEGWKVQSEQGDRVIMVKRKYGSLGAHLLIALLTIWWTLGLGNVLYAAYVYFRKADKKVIRASDI